MRRCLLLLASLLGVSVAQQCFDSGDKLINKKCFKLVNQKLSFNDARNWCHYSNPITPSYLATVDDQTTSTFLASYARTAFNTNEGKFWIGLSRNSTNSPLYWDDGTRFGWDNFDFKDAQNFVAEKIENARWTTNGPDSKFNFVCSYDPNAPPTFAPASPTPYWPTAAQSTAGFTTPPADSSPEPTPTGDPRCIPTGKTTFLFGYSTEFPASIVSQVKDVVVQALTANPRGNVKFANVRFDSNNGSVIYYHDDVQSFSASIQSHLPYPGLIFPVHENETDAFPVIQKFLEEPGIPLCGSTIFFLTRRLCYNCNTWRQTSYQLPNQRITAHFIQSNYNEGGGLDPPYLTSDWTNGLIVNAGQRWSENELSFPQVAEKMMGAPFVDNLLYADYFWQRQRANITDKPLRTLKVPAYADDFVNVSLVITTDVFATSNFQSITLSFSDTLTHKNSTVHYDRTDQFSDTDSIWKTIQLKSGSTSDVYMDYQTGFVGNVQIRMYIDRPVPDNWVSPPVINDYSHKVLRVEPKH